MSEENVEIVRRAYEHFARSGEVDLGVIDPEIEWDNSDAALDAAVYHGHEGVRDFFALARDMWDHQRFEPEEFIRVGEGRVVVPQRIVSVGRDGIETVARNATMFTLREGKIVRMKAFQTKSEALKAAGLSE